MAWGMVPSSQEREDQTKKDRDVELENILGNLMIAMYQVKKLEQRLSNHTGDSQFMFRDGDDWFRVKVFVEKMPEENKEPTEPVSEEDVPHP